MDKERTPGKHLMSYSMSLAVWALIGLACGALIGLLVVIVVDGPSALFRERSSEFVGFGRSLAIPVIIIGAVVGSVIGLIAKMLLIAMRR